ncbi:hypothetical protein PHOSAC3_120042 [Mesotoga infera]|nr:hypothetical protein PHOSAC3_120042 [Mesotoga infera]
MRVRIAHELPFRPFGDGLHYLHSSNVDLRCGAERTVFRKREKRERERKRERKGEKRKICSGFRVLGLGYRKSRSEARWREEVMPVGSSGEVRPTASGSDAGAYARGTMRGAAYRSS